MAIMTPPLHARGVFKLKTPWNAPADHVFEVIAIRSFRDFIERGDDVFKRFYLPKDETEDKYKADLALGANIITLESETLPVIHVPDTYIEAFPDVTGVAYKRVVLSVLLGPLPDTTDLTDLKANVAEVVSDTIGVESVVQEHIAPFSGLISQEQHEIMETRRQAEITNRTTPYAEVLRLQALVNDLTAKNTALTQWIIDHGGTPTP